MKRFLVVVVSIFSLVGPINAQRRPRPSSSSADISTQLSEDIDKRLKLIGYYDWNGRSSLDRLRLRAHVLWMVENHPEHPAVAEPSLRDLRDDVEGTAQITALWQIS